MADFVIPKDADFSIAETLTGQDITGATITWMLLPPDTRFDGDLDDLVAVALVAKDNATLTGVTLTTPGSGLFTVTLEPADTEGIAPGPYLVAIRYETSSADMVGVDSYEVSVVA